MCNKLYYKKDNGNPVVFFFSFGLILNDGNPSAIENPATPSSCTTTIFRTSRGPKRAKYTLLL